MARTDCSVMQNGCHCLLPRLGCLGRTLLASPAHANFDLAREFSVSYACGLFELSPLFESNPIHHWNPTLALTCDLIISIHLHMRCGLLVCWTPCVLVALQVLDLSGGSSLGWFQVSEYTLWI